MKKLISFFFICMIIQNVSAKVIIPQLDTLPNKWNFGMHTAYQTNSRILEGVELGLFAERKINSNFGLESEISISRNKLNNETFNQSNRNIHFINASLFAKLYFGKNKRWYAKAGYSFRRDLSTDNINGLNGPALGIGHNVKIGKHLLKLELNASYTQHYGLISGFKIGFHF